MKIGEKSCCIVNYASGAWYPAGQQRLKKSLDRVGYRGSLMLFDRLPDGCPPHAEVPYAFKPACIEAAREAGYELVLWADASFWAVKDVRPVFEEIEEVGHLMPPEAFSVGTWCTDAALKTLDLTREDAFGVPLVKAGFMGLDLTNYRSRAFLEGWLGLSRDGVTFKGPWTREGLDTDDERVLGHRHDLTAASVVAWRLNMERSSHGVISTDWKNPPPTAIFMARGGVAEI